MILKDTAPSEAEGKTVQGVLVEDDPEMSLLVAHFLAMPGWPVHKFSFSAAGTLSGGLRLLDERGAEVLLMDLNLPDSRGLETLKQVRARHAELPIVVLTSMGTEDIGVKAMALGAQDFLAKDRMDARGLQRVVSYAVTRGRLRKSLKDLIEIAPAGAIAADPGMHDIERRVARLAEEIRERRRMDDRRALHSDAIARGLRQPILDVKTAFENLMAEFRDSLTSPQTQFAALVQKGISHLQKVEEVVLRYTPDGMWEKAGESAARGRPQIDDAEFAGAFLFMDIHGFTDFSEREDPGVVASTLNALFAPATRIIYACGGDVDKFIGDCIFAVFRSAAAAVEAGRKLLALTLDPQETGAPFAVRIGVNEGRAVRANVGGPERREYAYLGDAVNLAQRLESLCAPGSMLVEDRTLAAAGLRLADARRRRILVKGRAEPVDAWEWSP